MAELVEQIAEAIRVIDRSAVPFKNFQPGVGPYGEPQLARLICEHLRTMRPEYADVRTCRKPDLLIPTQWAIEFKIVRPFGDNGKEAEHWSQNLLHPYAGNVSAIADIYKLLQHDGPERRGIIVLGFEHEPPKIELSTIVAAFELLSAQLLRLPLGPRHSSVVLDCIHPVHQRATVFGWEIEEAAQMGDSLA